MPSKRVRKEKKDRSRRNRKYRLWCKRNAVVCCPQLSPFPSTEMREFEVSGYKTRVYTACFCSSKAWYSAASAKLIWYNTNELTPQ